jgi:hypothetical protein
VHRDKLARPCAARTALAVALLATLAAAQPAEAQARKDAASRTAASRATSAPAPAPAPASGSALAAPAASPSSVPLPPPPAGASLRARGPGWLAVSGGAWAGFKGAAGAAVQADYGFLRTPPTWDRLQLELRLSVMVSRPSEDTKLTVTAAPPVGPPIQIASGSEKMNAWVVEVVPTARVRYSVHPKVALFADGGAGLGQTVERYERDELFQGHTEKSVNQTTVVVRVGGGLTVDLSERTRLVVLPLALSLQLGTGFSAYLPTLGLAYRL